MGTDNPLISFRNVSYSYPGQIEPALKEVTFSIPSGSRTLILGSNGSGKSTLTRLITGLLRPDSGTVHVNGLDASDRKSHRSIRTRAGLLFQNPSNQIVATVVREDTAFGPENLTISSAEIRERVENALGKTGLAALSRRATHDLSAGQQQRLALAGVLALGSDCLILDEAASMLNPAARKDMDQLLDELHDKGHTIIQVSHFMHRINKADQILILKEGILQLDGSRQEFLERSESLPGWSLDLPQVVKISGRLSREVSGLAPSLDENRLAEEIAFLMQGKKIPETRVKPETTSVPVRNDGDLLLSLQNVSFRYNSRSSRPVSGVEELDFNFYRGETAVLMGTTGSGKSTFLQLLNSLLLPQEGSLSLLGENPLEKTCDLAGLRRRIGLAMQQPERQLFAPLVGDDVAFGPRQLGLQGRELSLRVKEALELMELPFNEFRDRSIRALSGGQKRKAALAGILAMKPEILLLDEPTAGLDSLAAENLENLLCRLREEGISLILTTHDVEQALRMGSRLIVMDQGRKAFDGDSAAFFRQDEPVRYGLEYPLASRIWQKTGGGGECPLSEEDLVQQVLNFCVPEVQNESV